MATALDSIINGVREDLALRKTKPNNFDEKISHLGAPISPFEYLRKDTISVISEIKRSSPSKGELANIADPQELALKYIEGGASAISVLTEERRFKGSIADFVKVREVVKIPMLRKDFIVDEFQIKETRAIGADLQLLIVAALSKTELSDFYQMGSELGLATLFEIHDHAELEIAMDLSPQIVGVNSRNLKTLKVDVDNFAKLIPEIPNTVIKVAESGISNAKEVSDLRTLGADAILVGETLVKAGDPIRTLRELIGR